MDRCILLSNSTYQALDSLPMNIRPLRSMPPGGKRKYPSACEELLSMVSEFVPTQFAKRKGETIEFSVPVEWLKRVHSDFHRDEMNPQGLLPEIEVELRECAQRASSDYLDRSVLTNESAKPRSVSCSDTDLQRAEFSAQFREQKPPLTWTKIAQKWRDQSGEPVDDSAFYQSIHRARKAGFVI
jgi:hypothetical protein